MSENKNLVIAEREDLVAIADATRNATGTTEQMSLYGIANAINEINGGINMEIVQQTGTSTTAVMSQAAVTNEINGLTEEIAKLQGNSVCVFTINTFSNEQYVLHGASYSEIKQAYDNNLPIIAMIESYDEISLARVTVDEEYINCTLYYKEYYLEEGEFYYSTVCRTWYIDSDNNITTGGLEG